MSGHEKKGRAVRVAGKSPIAAPPRVAVQGRSKADHHEDNASTKSTKSTTDGNGSDIEDAELDIKDKKIVELEKELATMEMEFERELTQLSHKMTDESESANIWQQKHSTLYQAFLKTDTDLRLLRQEVNSFQVSREERDRDIKTRISSLMLDRDAFREAYNEAMGETKSKDDMIQALKSQVWGLKSFVSTSSKMDEQVADEAFAEYMQRLGNSLQNWVITNFRRTKIGKLDFSVRSNKMLSPSIDIEKANDDIRNCLMQLVPTYEMLASSSKIHLIQSLVSRLLVNFIFQEYFIGLPKAHSDELRNMEKYLGGFGKGFRDTSCFTDLI
jgi:activating signal cointegrator complex subunit 1